MLNTEQATLTLAIEENLQRIETNHYTAIEAVFDEKEDTVDRYLDTLWLPEFVSHYVEALALGESDLVAEVFPETLEQTSLQVMNALREKQREYLHPLQTLAQKRC